MKNRLINSLLVLAAISLAVSCSKDNNTDNDTDTATIQFQYDFNVDGEPLEYGTTYTINGDVVSFKAANFYIGGLELKQSNGNTLNFEDQYLLAGLQNTVAINNEIPVSSISSATFFIGVDSVNNAQSETDFTTRPTTDPLSIQDPSMHWNWNSGYRFLRVDGEVDTDGDGTVDTPIAYHLGSNPFLKPMQINKEIPITKGQNTIYFSFDLNKFFDGVIIKTELDTHTGNNIPLAEKLHANLDQAVTMK